MYFLLKKYLNVNGKKIKCSSFVNFDEIEWKNDNIDIVIDCTGIEKKINEVKKTLLKNNIKFIIYTNSSNIVDKEIVMGINENILSKK